MNQDYMKTKPILPLVLSMSLPMVLSMLVNSLYNIVDSFFVALNCKMKLELRNWDKGACPFIPIRAAAAPLFSFLY